MGIKLNSSTLVGEFKYILSTDPALDTEAKDFTEKFRIFLENGTMPPIKEGMKPAIWTLRPIVSNDLITKFRGDTLKNGPQFHALQWGRYSIRHVDDLNDPETGEPFIIEFQPGDFGMERISAKTDARIPADIMIELGIASAGHSSFS